MDHFLTAASQESKLQHPRRNREVLKTVILFSGQVERLWAWPCRHIGTYAQPSVRLSHSREFAFIRGCYPKNPNFTDPKFTKFGNTLASAVSGIPNHEHSVAPY